jgi:hypothetical protein
VSNGWNQISPGIYEWDQATSPNIQKIWISTTTGIVWSGYGPWNVSNTINGLENLNSAGRTFGQVSLQLQAAHGQLHWLPIVEPEWVGEQYSYYNPDMKFSIQTDCDYIEAIGGFNNVQLNWIPNKPYQLIQGNWAVVKLWNNTVYILASGKTMVPTCTHKIYLPLIVR